MSKDEGSGSRVKKLTDSQTHVLLMVGERCDGQRYFMPPELYRQVQVNLGKYRDGVLQDVVSTVSMHAGVCTTLRSLEARGLIQRPKTAPVYCKYAYEMTDAGRLAVEAYRTAETGVRA